MQRLGCQAVLLHLMGKVDFHHFMGEGIISIVLSLRVKENKKLLSSMRKVLIKYQKLSMSLKEVMFN